MTTSDAATLSGDPAWTKVPDLKEEDIWIGEMTSVTVNGEAVLILNAEGELRAYSNRCPHQESPLDDGMFEDGVVTCSSHLWEFDAVSGAGINPSNVRLVAYDLRIGEGGELYVRMASCQGATDCLSATSTAKKGS